MLDYALDLVQGFLNSPYKNQSSFPLEVGRCQEFSRSPYQILPEKLTTVREKRKWKVS